MAENFPNLKKETDIQIQEGHSTKQNEPKHNKNGKVNTKERILKPAIEKKKRLISLQKCYRSEETREIYPKF